MVYVLEGMENFANHLSEDYCPNGHSTASKMIDTKAASWPPASLNLSTQEQSK